MPAAASSVSVAHANGGSDTEIRPRRGFEAPPAGHGRSGRSNADRRRDMHVRHVIGCRRVVDVLLVVRTRAAATTRRVRGSRGRSGRLAEEGDLLLLEVPAACTPTRRPVVELEHVFTNARHATCGPPRRRARG